MTFESEVNIHILDAAYKPFPPFSVWTARTTVETGRWKSYLEILDQRSKPDSDLLKRAREAAKRAAAIDTGAIEGLYDVDRGFTYTIAFETSAWEAALAAKGEGVRSLFESQLHAYDFVLDLATKAEPISEAAIRRLHEEVCAAQPTYHVMTAIGPQQQPLPKGEYKVLPNHVRTRKGIEHSYAPVDVTPDEMFRLVTEMRTEPFLNAHPVLQASYAHYCFTVIHPFADGNGRVARALASTFTYRAISMPIIILSEYKTIYLDSLESADDGDYQSFVDFLLARSLDTIKLVDESIKASLSPNAETGITKLNSLYITKGGFSQDQIDKAGIRLVEVVVRELEIAFSANKSKKADGQVRSTKTTYEPPINSEYRSPMPFGYQVDVSILSAVPAKTIVRRQYQLFVPKDAGRSDDLQIVNANGTEGFSARADEVISLNWGLLIIRTQLFANRVYGEMLAELAILAEKLLRT